MSTMKYMKHATQILLFLHSMKEFVEENGFLLVQRDASMQFMADNNISVQLLKNIMLELELTDCLDGPEPDRDPKYSSNWTVAEFAPLFESKRIYL